MQWIYIGIKKAPAMPQIPWESIIDKIENNCPGTNDAREHSFQKRYNLNDPFDAAIYEANFTDADITLERLRQLLVQVFNLADNRVTVTTTSQTFLNRPSPIGAFRLDGTIMFRMTIFGGYNATWLQSRDECDKYIQLNTIEWNGQ